MRDLLMNVTTNDTANPLAERGALLGLSETFRRRINILYAFIRCGADSHALISLVYQGRIYKVALLRPHHHRKRLNSQQPERRG